MSRPAGRNALAILPAVLCCLSGLLFLLWIFAAVLGADGRATTWVWGPRWLGLTLPGVLGFLWICGLLQLILAVWVGMDAHRRGMNGPLWGLLVFFTCVVGVVVYLLVVGGETAGGPGWGTPGAGPGRPCCARCGAGLEVGFVACPYCGRSVGSRCPECGERVAEDWNVCPLCAHPLERRGAEPAP